MARRVAKQPTETKPRAPVGEAEWDEARGGWLYPDGQFVAANANGPFPSDPKGGVKTPPRKQKKAEPAKDPEEEAPLALTRSTTIRDDDATRVYTIERYYFIVRPLITISPIDAVWEDIKNLDVKSPLFAGAIVRIDPPEDATQEQVVAIEAQLSTVAVAIKVLPRGKAASVVVQPTATAPWEARLTQRQRVEKVVEDANSRDIDALRALCTDVMDEVGL